VINLSIQVPINVVEVILGVIVSADGAVQRNSLVIQICFGAWDERQQVSA
jgi:hypothetical protein